MIFNGVQIFLDGAILGCLMIIISILRDVASMERFNYHGAEKID
jgi:hypothetical protein